MNKNDQMKKEYLASFASCLSTNHKSFSSNSLNNSSKINLIPISHAPILPINDFKKVQSTKITLNHKRYASQPKLFSLLDINDKVTNVRSTNLPIQYKRRSPEEIKQLFSNSPIVFNEKNRLKNLIDYEDDLNSNDNRQQILNNSMFLKNVGEINASCLEKSISENIVKDNINFNNNQKVNAQEGNQNNDNNLHKEETTQDNQQKIHNYLEKIDKGGSFVSRNRRLYKPHIFDKTNNELNLTKIPIDKYKPIYLEIYENLRKQASMNQHKPIPKPNIKETLRSKSVNKNNELDSSRDLDKSLPLLFHKEMKQKSFRTDIFFLKQQEQPNPNDKLNIINELKKSNTQKHYQSNIFLLKNDEISRNKSGEKNYYKVIPAYKYTSSRESNSMWNTKNIMPPLLNHSSSEHHILNPSIKNISQTKEQINQKYKEMNISRNVTHKQKGLSEFIDLSRISALNLNKDYLEMYNKNNKTFAKINNVCSDFNDMYGKGYSKLCDKPFQPFQPV